MTEQCGGLVAVVYPDPAGVVVTVDAATSDTVLSVADATDLVGYPDGLLQLPSGSYAAYDGYTLTTGADPDLVTLSSGLAAGFTAEMTLDLYEVDVDGDHVPVVTYWATVLTDDGDAVEAVVDPHWITQLRPGIRDTGRQERVICQRDSDGDDWVLRRPVRRVPKVDLSTARAGSLPPGAIGPGMLTGDFELDGTLKLGAGSALVDSAGMPIVDGLDSGSLPSAFTTLTGEVADLAALVLALPGATPDDDMYVDELSGDIYFVAT